MRTTLAETGVPHTDLVRELDGWLSNEPGRRLEGALGYGLLHELWLTATAVAAWAPLAEEALSDVSPSARRAMDTLAPGGLRTVVPQVLDSPGTGQDLSDLLWSAFDYGTRTRSSTH
jgi:hypothetical protein